MVEGLLLWLQRRMDATVMRHVSHDRSSWSCM